MSERPGFSTSVMRILSIATLTATMLVIPGVGSTDERPSVIEQRFGEQTAETAQAMIPGPPGMPQATIDLSLQGGIGEEGDTLQAVLTVSGWPEPFSALLMTSGKDGDFSDGGEHPTATGDVDYFESRRSFYIDAPGAYVLGVTTFDDAEVEGNEWFMVLAGPQGAFPPYSFDLRVRSYIVDNDTAATPFLSFDDVTVTEGDAGTSTANFTLSLQPAATTTVEAEFSTCGVGCADDATAASGEDYLLVRETLTFAPGETSKTIPVTILGDTEVEDDEIFYINLLDVVNVGVEDGVGVGTILNDDSAVTSQLSVDDVSVTEGDTGTTTADFTITLSPAATSPVEVEYSTCGHACNPTATADAGTDYISTHTTVTFNPGQTIKTIPVTINGDTDIENDETFFLGLLDAVGATIAHSPGIGTILNDDAAVTSQLSVNDVTVVEGDSGTTGATFTVSLFPAAASTVTVEYGTCGVGCLPDATATKGVDYEVVSGTLSFAPGQTAKTVTVPVIGDTKVEDDEIFYVLIFDPVGATVADDRGLGTILNDDSGGGGGPPLCNGLQATIWGSGLLTGTAGNDIIVGGPGNDEIRGNGGDDVLCGLGGDDTIIGGPGNDQMWGDTGDDLIKGLQGDDILYGGPGDDRLQGNAGMDLIQGDEGKDKMWGGIGPDLMSGGAGNDQLHGGPGGDGLMGGTGTDRIWGDADDDHILGNDQSDFLYGGIGTDTIEGGPGNDRLFGWTGNDLLYGNEGRDQLRGQTGDDLVDGGPDYDYCSLETTWLNCEQAI